MAPLWAGAQTNADDYFNHGAQYYIFGDKTNAEKSISNGLRVFPSDQKLNEVAKLLKKKEEQQQQQQKQQQQQQNQDKKDQKDQQKQGQKSDQQKKDEEKARQEQAKKDKEKKDQEKKDEQQAAQDDKKDQKDDKGEGADATEAHMSPKEARQLLDSLKDDAKMLIFTNQASMAQHGPIKDW